MIHVNISLFFYILLTFVNLEFDLIGLDLVRKVEVHRARVAEKQDIKVYFLAFHNSVEEQIYLNSIQREKRAFEALIQEKGTMVGLFLFP